MLGDDISRGYDGSVGNSMLLYELTAQGIPPSYCQSNVGPPILRLNITISTCGAISASCWVKSDEPYHPVTFDAIATLAYPVVCTSAMRLPSLVPRFILESMLEWSWFHCSLRELDCSTARYAAGLRMPSAEWGARVL